MTTIDVLLSAHSALLAVGNYDAAKLCFDLFKREEAQNGLIDDLATGAYYSPNAARAFAKLLKLKGGQYQMILSLAKQVEELSTTQSVEPVAIFHGLVDSGEHGAFNLDLLKMIPRGAELFTRPAPSDGSWYKASDIDVMVRDLDIALNGENAAHQAMLCDLMPSLIARLSAPVEAQIVEPLMWMWAQADDNGQSGTTMDKRELKQLKDDYPDVVITPLFTHPAPATPTLTAEREALISDCNLYVKVGVHLQARALVKQCADMLAADVLEIEELECDYTDQVLRAMGAEAKRATIKGK